MTKFCLRMAFSHNFRKCYRLVLLSALLMFHFYHLSLFKLPLELAPSSVVCLLLFSHRVSERAFRFLQQERTLLGVALFSIVCLFAPHFLPLGVTTGALIFGAAFFTLIVGLPYGKEAFFEAKRSWRIPKASFRIIGTGDMEKNDNVFPAFITVQKLYE